MDKKETKKKTSPKQTLNHNSFDFMNIIRITTSIHVMTAAELATGSNSNQASYLQQCKNQPNVATQTTSSSSNIE